ncbi:MAG TPA: 30S ribosome-binding factor RbfA [Methylococcaceae bacterium]|jgi:ribosome-binding factor A|nr:30S ribosome-binding factor RbfA [Methylococcaceae bacterium]
MPREFTRRDRVASQLQKELAELLQLHVRDKRLGMVTVSGVEVTRDLAVVKVFVSFLGASESVKECLGTLSHAVPMLRHELGKRIRMRIMPELRFVHDESIERGMRMEALLSRLESGTAAEDLGEDS